MRHKLIIIILSLFLMINMIYATPQVLDYESSNVDTDSATISFSCNPIDNLIWYTHSSINSSNNDFRLRWQVDNNQFKDDSEHVDVGRLNTSGLDMRYIGINSFNMTKFKDQPFLASLNIYYINDLTTQLDSMNVGIYTNTSWNYSLPDCNADAESRRCYENIANNGSTLLYNWTNTSSSTNKSYPISFDITDNLNSSLYVNDGLYTIAYFSDEIYNDNNINRDRMIRLGDFDHFPAHGGDETNSTYIAIDNVTYCNYSLNVYSDSARTNLINLTINNSQSDLHSLSISGLNESTTYYLNLTVWNATGVTTENNTYSFTTTSSSTTSAVSSNIHSINTGILAIVGLFGAIFAALMFNMFYSMYQEGHYDMDSLRENVIIIVIVGILLGIGFIIIAALAGVV